VSNQKNIQEEIRDVNLSYLLLAKQMLLEDRETAIYRLGICKDLASIIVSLSPAQILKMAASNMLLCRFRFDDSLLFNMVSSLSKETPAAQIHSAIMMSGQGVETLVA
jgi:flagellar transcriptional activator FlhD